MAAVEQIPEIALATTDLICVSGKQCCLPHDNWNDVFYVEPEDEFSPKNKGSAIWGSNRVDLDKDFTIESTIIPDGFLEENEGFAFVLQRAGQQALGNGFGYDGIDGAFPVVFKADAGKENPTFTVSMPNAEKVPTTVFEAKEVDYELKVQYDGEKQMLDILIDDRLLMTGVVGMLDFDEAVWGFTLAGTMCVEDMIVPRSIEVEEKEEGDLIMEDQKEDDEDEEESDEDMKIDDSEDEDLEESKEADEDEEIEDKVEEVEQAIDEALEEFENDKVKPGAKTVVIYEEKFESGPAPWSFVSGLFGLFGGDSNKMHGAQDEKLGHDGSSGMRVRLTDGSNPTKQIAAGWQYQFELKEDVVDAQLFFQYKTDFDAAFTKEDNAAVLVSLDGQIWPVFSCDGAECTRKWTQESISLGPMETGFYTLQIGSTLNHASIDEREGKVETERKFDARFDNVRLVAKAAPIEFAPVEIQELPPVVVVSEAKQKELFVVLKEKLTEAGAVMPDEKQVQLLKALVERMNGTAMTEDKQKELLVVLKEKLEDNNTRMAEEKQKGLLKALMERFRGNVTVMAQEKKRAEMIAEKEKESKLIDLLLELIEDEEKDVLNGVRKELVGRFAERKRKEKKVLRVLKGLIKQGQKDLLESPAGLIKMEPEDFPEPAAEVMKGDRLDGLKDRMDVNEDKLDDLELTVLEKRMEDNEERVEALEEQLNGEKEERVAALDERLNGGE